MPYEPSAIPITTRNKEGMNPFVVTTYSNAGVWK